MLMQGRSSVLVRAIALVSLTACVGQPDTPREHGGKADSDDETAARQWRREDSGVTSSLRDVSATTDGRYYAVDRDGSLLLSRASGPDASWLPSNGSESSVGIAKLTRWRPPGHL
jgi:hypothetical protein